MLEYFKNNSRNRNMDNTAKRKRHPSFDGNSVVESQQNSLKFIPRNYLITDSNLIFELFFVDSPGDGNCFYHSLSNHHFIPFNNAEQLKEYMFNDAMNNYEIYSLLTVYDFGNRSLDEICIDHKGKNVWAWEISIYFACVAFGIDRVFRCLGV
jgi:hypothetical protein